MGPQPGNVWVTWVNQTGHQDFCLAMQLATSPFRTCLISVPLNYSRDISMFKGYVRNISHCELFYNDSAANMSRCLIQLLNITSPWNSQELELLGSEGTQNESETCLCFADFSIQDRELLSWHMMGLHFPYWDQKNRRLTTMTLVNPRDGDTFKWEGGYCGYTANETRYGFPNRANKSSEECRICRPIRTWDFGMLISDMLYGDGSLGCNRTT
ncbi:uncharacterized protein LOC136055360 [Cyrtonyx montezumae]|uniref:uncharacterized protein LOC136055360 n=1 Tax=Cyrtonyx montezumae TaxID=9017 RepID=UPI0032DB8712